MPKVEVIRNPFLNAVMWDLCYNISDEQKKTLSIYYRRILASSLRTKNFCENSSIDTKLRFFHSIGLSNALTIFPDKIKSAVALKSILQKYEEHKIAAAQKEHAVMSVYVTTDKETAFLLGLMSQTIHSKNFLLNLDFNKTGYHLKKWDKQLNTISSKELNESVENADVIVKTMSNTCLSMNAITTLFDINSVDMQILFYLYQYRQSYISRERVWDTFAGFIQKKRTTMSLKRLMTNEYTKKHTDWRNLQYTISTKGINLVNDFVIRILKANNF